MPPSVATAANRCPELSLVMDHHLRPGAVVSTQFVVVNIIAEVLRTLGCKPCTDDAGHGCKVLEDLRMDLYGSGSELIRYELAILELVEYVNLVGTLKCYMYVQLIFATYL